MKKLVDFVYENPGNFKMYRRSTNGVSPTVLVGNQSRRQGWPYRKVAVVFGAGGFIGSHMVEHLVREGYWVRGVDLKYPEFSRTVADDFIIGDLRDYSVVSDALNLPEVTALYQFAADMGGAGFVFTGDNDADIMHNSALINLNTCEALTKTQAVYSPITRVFYASSACMYPEYNQLDPNNPKCSEDSAYPAAPDSEYGWEKLFSERLYLAFARNYGVDVRIARYHNIFGPNGTWDGGREKAPAALCRKVIEEVRRMDKTGATEGEIEVWGDGTQTRSFLYIDECIQATVALMESDFKEPVNIGSEEMVSINRFAEMIIGISGKNIRIKHIDGPLGVRGRNSDNKLFKEKMGWAPSRPLISGLEETYRWIETQIP